MSVRNVIFFFQSQIFLCCFIALGLFESTMNMIFFTWPKEKKKVKSDIIWIFSQQILKEGFTTLQKKLNSSQCKSK